MYQAKAFSGRIMLRWPLERDPPAVLFSVSPGTPLSSPLTYFEPPELLTRGRSNVRATCANNYSTPREQPGSEIEPKPVTEADRELCLLTSLADKR